MSQIYSVLYVSFPVRHSTVQPYFCIQFYKYIVLFYIKKRIICLDSRCCRVLPVLLVIPVFGEVMKICAKLVAITSFDYDAFGRNLIYRLYTTEDA